MLHGTWCASFLVCGSRRVVRFWVEVFVREMEGRSGAEQTSEHGSWNSRSRTIRRVLVCFNEWVDEVDNILHLLCSSVR